MHPHPTESELEILQVLWHRGPSTVREVNDELSEKREVGYTTTLKLMQIMTEKKLLSRVKAGKTHIYKADAGEEATQKAMLDRITDTAFGGSAMKLVMQALGNHNASQAEIRQIRDFLDQIEKED